MKNAIRLGAHSVEHGYIMDDECIELLLKHDTWYVPTLAISHLTPEQVDNDWERAWVKQRNMPHVVLLPRRCGFRRARRLVQQGARCRRARWRSAPTSGR